MPSTDPLAELAPFLNASREGTPDDSPPDYLTARLIASRNSGIGPASSPIPEEELPRVFGLYSLEKILGRGATGTVYGAYDPELDRRIAIKILSPELAALPEARKRFLREARAAAGLQHDHLMPVFAVHQDTPYPCLTMPLLEGETLQQKIDREGPLPDELLIELARQITSALQCAHHQKILHRDLKPSNIFFETTTQRAIVMDFGLARSLHQPSDLTVSGAIAGTPEFLAPEQIDDEPHLTPATDLYGLGATLYTLASCRPPFSAQSLTGLLKKVATAAPEPLQNRPSWFNKLILSLLSKEASQRPSSAEKVLQFLSSEDSPSQKPHDLKRRLVFLSAAIVTLCGVLLWFVFTRKGEEPFSLEEALASGQSEIVIPKNGLYELDPILLDHDLTLIAEEAGTILRFTSTITPITTSANLTFKNLTLRDDLPQEEETRNFIVSSGDSLRFLNCRLEQAGRETAPLIQAPWISAEKALELSLEDSDLISFRTPFFQSKSPSTLTMQNSLALVPAILIANDSGGHTVTLDRVRAVCLSLIFASPQSDPTHFSSKLSQLEVNHTFIWAPGTTPENLKTTVHWSGDHNTFATTRGWLTNSLSRRRTRERNETDLGSFDQWQNFWDSDENSTEVEPTILPMNLPRTLEHPSEVNVNDL